MAGFTFRLEREDGTPADPPVLHTAVPPGAPARFVPPHAHGTATLAGLPPVSVPASGNVRPASCGWVRNQLQLIRQSRARYGGPSSFLEGVKPHIHNTSTLVKPHR